MSQQGVNNAKSKGSNSSINNIDVCIFVQGRGDNTELRLSYDNREEQIISLSSEQKAHLIKLLQE